MPLKHIFLQSYANTRISVFSFSKSTTKFWHFTFLFVFHLPLSPYITPFPFQNLLTLCLKIFWDEISFTHLHIHGVKNKQLSVAIIKQEQSQQMQLAQCCCHSFWSSENSKNKIIYFKKQKPRTLNYYCCIPTVRSGCIPPCYVPWLPSEGKVDTGAGRGWNTAQPSTPGLQAELPGPNPGRGCCVSGGLQWALSLCCASAEGSSGFAFMSGEEEEKTKYDARITRRNNHIQMYLCAVSAR